MAEPTKTKIYTFGDRKLDYGKYITNLENNVESYLQNQRDTEGWDDARAQEFRNAFGEIISHFRGDYLGDGTRFSTNQMGAIMDSLGVLNNTDSDDFYYNKKGEQIDRATYDALKDRKRRKYSSFEANREVAEYFRRIGSYMKDYEDTTEKFDISKHGFNAWLMDKEAPGGTFNYQNYWDLDPVDEKTGKRGTAKREEVAAKWMEDYLKEMKDKTFNFEGNKTFSSMDDYLKRGNEVLAEWKKSGWNAQDRINAQRLGIDNDFMTKFFGTEGDPALSNEENAEQKAQREQQAKIEQELKNEEDRQAAYRKWVDEQVASHTNMKYPYSKNAPYYTNLFSWDRYYKDGQPTEEYDRLLGNLVVTTADGHRKAINQMTELEKGKNLGLLLNKYVNNLYNPRFNPSSVPVNNHYMYLIQLLSSHYALDLGDGSYYIPSTKLSNTALIFDSNAKTLYHTFIGDLPDIWELRKKAYWDKVNGTSPNASYYEEGGIIKALDGSALLNQAAMKYFADRASKREEQLATKALAKNRTIEQLTAAERKAHAPFAGFEEDNTWSTEEYARFGGALADITAAISAFVPGYGTAVSGVAGIGSTLANFGADWADDSVSAGLMWKNFGVNLGMDVLGLVPYGGAAGKFTKIARNIGKYIPRLMAVIGTSAALQNKDEILGSFKKALNDPANLTVGDWQNISQGIGVATGLTAGAGRAVLKKAKETNSSTDFAAIRLQSRSNPKNKVNKVVSAKTAADLRAATTNDEIRLILKRDHPHLLENYDIDVRGGLYGKELTFSPSWKDKSLIKTKEPLARIYEVRRDSKGNLYGYNGKWKSDLALYTTHGKAKQQYRKSSLTTGTMPWGERDAYLRDFNKVRRFTSEDADFQDARWKSESDLSNTPYKKSLLEDANTRRANEVEYQKPFRDKHGTTADIQGRLADARTYSKSSDYQTAVGQHAALTQQHADLVARHLPIIDSYKQKLNDINQQIVFFTNESLNATTKRDKNYAERMLKKLNEDRVDILGKHDALAKELADSETKVKLNAENVKRGSDERIKELEDLEFKSKFHDESMKKLDDEINRLQQLGGKHTPAYLELLLKRAKDGKITFTDERNQQFTVDAARALRLAGIRKHGGLLKAVEKFQDSGKIKSPMRDVLNKGNVNWYTDMFTNGLNASKTDENNNPLPNWFDKWKIDDPVYNPDKFNQLQKDWYNNLQATGYQEGSNKAVRNPGVKTRQPNWDDTGGNAPIADMLKPGPNGEPPKLVGNGGTEDKPDETTGKFGADGVFGQQEFLRHAGRASDWEGKDTELAEFNKKLAERGLVYEKDRSGETDMMMLYPLDKKPEEKSGEKPEEKKASSVIPPGKKKQDDKSQSPSILAKVNSFLSNPEMYSVSRLFNTLGQIDREVDLLRQKRPHLNNVVDNHLYVRKDNYALYNARRALENLMHMASQPVTSDGAQARTFYGDNFIKLLDYGLQGNQLADAKYWETSDASKQHEIAKQEERNKNANENGRTLAEHAHDMITTQQVADFKRTTALHNYLYEKQYRLEEKYNDAQAALRAADDIILDNDISTNLSKYAKQFNITPQEITVWNKVQSGTLPTSLSKEEKALWESVYNKVQTAKTLLRAQQQGADISDFALVRSMSKDNKSTSPTAYTPPPSWVINQKNGGKAQAKARVKVARIREKMKNADRTARAIEKDLDRVLKTVESINKRMYGIKR